MQHYLFYHKGHNYSNQYKARYLWAFIIILKQSTASILYVHSAYEILKRLALKIWRYFVDGNVHKNSRTDYSTHADISIIALFNHILTRVCICTYLHDCSIRGGMKSLIFHLTFFAFKCTVSCMCHRGHDPL